MKWKSHTWKPRRVIVKVNPAKSGGAFDRESTLALQMSPGLFATLWRRPYQRPRSQPRTMPLWAALPVLIWLWWTGELA